jgi:hypothetical protein
MEERADERHGPEEDCFSVTQHLVEDAESGLRFFSLQQRRRKGEADEDSRGRRLAFGALEARRALEQELDPGSGPGLGDEVPREGSSEGSFGDLQIPGDGFRGVVLGEAGMCESAEVRENGSFDRRFERGLECAAGPSRLQPEVSFDLERGSP